MKTKRTSIVKSRALRVVCAAALAFATVPAGALAAWAGDAGDPGAAEIALSDGGAIYTNAFNTLGGVDAEREAALSEALPSAVDLTNGTCHAKYQVQGAEPRDYATSVKFQNPWGTCWAFGISAASEISILGELGLKYSESDDFRLSEHHLAWFAKNHIPVEGEAAYDPQYDNPVNVQYQNGEGIWFKDGQQHNESMNAGHPFYATSMYGAGIGAVVESADPLLRYQGENGWVTAKLGKGIKDFESYDEAVAAGYKPLCYSEDDNWALPERLRFVRSYQLEESGVLPNTINKHDDGTWEYNGDIAAGKNEGVNAIKKQISENRGVTIGYYAEVGNSNCRYINTDTWAHYTYDAERRTGHCVTIMGYDDNYPASNFAFVPTKYDGNDHVVYTFTEAGAVLPNDADAGNKPYLVDNKGGRHHYETTSEIVEPVPGTEDQYRIKADYRELSNNAEGYSLVPGTDKVLDRDTYVDEMKCEAAKYPEAEGEAMTTPPGNGAWIIKNSWGSASEEFPNKYDWGDNGYLYISYYDKTLEQPESYDFIVGDEVDQYDTAYAACYDYLITESCQNELQDVPTSTANVFKAEFSDDGYTAVKLDGMSCNTSVPGTTVNYRLYLLPDDFTSPTQGRLVAEKTETYDYGGYHRVSFDPVYVPAGQKYSVVATQTAADTSTGKTKYVVPLSFAVRDQESSPPQTYINAVVNRGESFLLEADGAGGQKVEDWVDFLDDRVKEKQEDCTFDNPALKAYGTPLTATPAAVTSTGASFTAGAAAEDAVFTFGEGLDGFTADNFDAARGVAIDNAQLAASSYKVETGSVRLTLHKDYLNTLEAGTHAVRVYLKDSDALSGMPDYVEATLSVSKGTTPTPSASAASATPTQTSSTSAAKTGDLAAPVIVAIAGILMIAALVGAGIGTGLSRQRRR